MTTGSVFPPSRVSISRHPWQPVLACAVLGPWGLHHPGISGDGRAAPGRLSDVLAALERRISGFPEGDRSCAAATGLGHARQTASMVRQFVDAAGEPEAREALSLVAVLAFEAFLDPTLQIGQPGDWVGLLSQVFFARRVLEESAFRIGPPCGEGLIEPARLVETDRLRLALESARPMGAARIERSVVAQMARSDMIEALGRAVSSARLKRPAGSA